MHYLGQLPDLPLPGSGQRLRTRRKALAQIVLCKGCCCGQTERGLPAVPLDYLKPIWKSEKLNKVIQLTVSGCLGPCDLPNVCAIVTPAEQAWYGRLTTTEDYAVLVDWARQCQVKGEIPPLPSALAHLRFDRWPGDDEPVFTPIAQEPGDIVLLTAADTEVLTWSAAVERLPVGFASVRALNLDRLREPAVCDAYLDDVLQDSRVILLRVLGGLGYWRDQLEAIHLLARAHGIHLLCLPGDTLPDAQLARLNTVPLPVADTAWRYCIEGGAVNATALLHFLSDTLLGTQHGCAPPAALPEVGVYVPGQALPLDLATWRRHFPKRPATIGIAFYRAHWVTGNLAPVDALIAAVEATGGTALAVFGPNLDTMRERGLLPAGLLDALIVTTSFSSHFSPASGERGGGVGADVCKGITPLTPGPLPPQSRGERGAARAPWSPRAENPFDCPVLQAIFCASSENVWAANIAGLTPRDIAMNVALPEFDGRIITTAVSFKNTLTHDQALQTDVVRYQPRADRIDHVAKLAANWARLRATANGAKRVAILLANYPSKNARVGNAVGLDTPASLHRLLLALRAAGYDTGPELPADGQALIEQLIAASVQDAEFATGAAHTRPVGQVSRGQYARFLGGLTTAAAHGITARWGGAEQSASFHDEAFPVPGLRLGNVFVGIQPARGYDEDPSAVYHSPDLPPPPFYLAFYHWLAHDFAAHAVIHLGKHGNLEWLPGKSVALSASCYPEAMLGALPNIYPYIINNPGEGTQAKRRAAAVIVDHLIPPMTRADTYGELRQLELLLDEYYTVQSLDPAKGPLVLERIGVLVEQANLYRDLECAAVPSADDLPQLLPRLDGYLCEIKEAQIRDGLHILGQLPAGPQLIDLLAALVRIDNGPVLGLPKAIWLDAGRADFDALHRDPAAVIDNDRGWRTCGDAVSWLNEEARHLIEASGRHSLPADSPPFAEGRGACALLRRAANQQGANTSRTLAYLWEFIWPRLQQCGEEIDHVLAALAGRFVPPGPSGAPTRGAADVLPTGRNFYSLDIRAIPSATAWRVGSAAAESLLRRHRERTGSYPESVSLVVWGTSNMRTGGDDIACILALLGVRPTWDAHNRRVTGIELVPLVELDRPRIDVTVRISGLFRDAFPNLVRLLNDAVALVAGLAEPLDRNFIRANIARDTALLVRAHGEEAAGECTRRASLRIFGSKPGAYGAGLLPAIDGRNWQTPQDLADIYVTWSSYAYTGAADEDGRAERQAFQLRLARTDVVAQNQDNREHDIFDSDDYFQFHGGLVAAVKAVRGSAPAAYLGDTSRPDGVVTRTLREEACRVFRARVVNPRWLAGVLRHGYKGAVEMAATVDYLFGYDATAEVLDDWMYEQLAAAYLFDPAVCDFLRRSNPWAERAMIERLLEAAARGLWETPDPNTLARLQEQHGTSEAWLEGGPIP